MEISSENIRIGHLQVTFHFYEILVISDSLDFLVSELQTIIFSLSIIERFLIAYWPPWTDQWPCTMGSNPFYIG